MGVSAGRSRTRLLALVFCCLVAVWVGDALLTTGPQAYAQEGGGEGDKPPPQTDLTKKYKPTLGEMIRHVFVSIWGTPPVGPIICILLALLSIFLVALTVFLALDLRMGDAIPPFFVEEFTDTV